MHEMWNFWLRYGLVLFIGLLGTYSVDPFSKQPRIIVQNGHLDIRSGYNRNVTVSSNGQGSIKINNIDVGRVLQQFGRTSNPSTVSQLNRRLGQLLSQSQTISDLVTQVNQLEENVTEITQRMNQFVGTEQNRITNRGMRRYFAKVKVLEEKVNHLTQLLSTNECSSSPCRNGGTCVDSYNGYICTCPSNWEGPTCEADVNECALYSGTAFGCQNGATCTNLPGSYRCDCPTNRFGIHCTEQHDDCSTASHQELCGHGTCIDEKRVQPGQPKYRCICDPGWRTTIGSPACVQDIDECNESTESKCSVSPRVLCINLPGTFYCGPCPAGYTGNGLWCDDINECENQNGGCSINPFVECFNTPGSRRCGPCPTGYFGNGEQCMFQSVCSNNRGGCHPLATCIDNPAITTTYRECRCPPGYVGNGEGLTGCTVPQGITCAHNPCRHGVCQMVGQSYHCTCDAGYYGSNCENEEDPCLRTPCQNGGTCFGRSGGTFSCVCPTGYSGSNCEIEQRACGGYLNENNGTLHYPEYAQNYNHEESCAWIITVEEGKVVNITFDHFHLEPGFNCEFDFLQLNDGPNAGSRVIGRFCSDELHGESFTSTHNQIYLWFRSDRTISATGFTITWQAVNPVCGGSLNISDYGSIRSPGYPGVYPVNRTCSWLVQVPFGKRIQFSFATLMLEHHPNCSYDYLKIFDGATERDPLLGQYCTTEAPPPLITSGHVATLLFHSDSSVQDHGFNIAYSAMPAIQGCGGTVTSPQGSITSPNYPNVYQDNLLCEWLIRIHPDNRIRISFTDFHLEEHRNCAFDSLEVYDGSSDAAPLLGRFCGAAIPPEVTSNTHQFYLRFKTDMSSRFSGFKLDYRTICGGIYTELTGVLTSPYYPEAYPANSICLYEIRLPVGYLVNLTIHNIQIEMHSDCKFDYLEVRDGDSQNGPLMAHLCGNTAPESIVSTYNHLWMKFETDASVQNHGFSAQYEAIEIGCGGIYRDSEGQISSPQHPDMYPDSAKCTWLIRAPETHIIQLTFSTFVLESSSGCTFDYLLIEDTDGIPFGKYCGSTKPPVITSMGNSLILKFVTDVSVSSDGFTATYRFLDANEACGGDVYKESGFIRTPGYPYHYPHSAHCVWVIHAPNSRQITLNVTDFHTEYHSDCKYDYLEVRNGGYETSPLIGRYCGFQVKNSIRSHSNILRLEFKSDISMSAPGFEIYFHTSVVGCGGTLTSFRGSIISPNYPQPYPYNANCEWLISVSQGSAISLAIVDIDIEEHEVCRFDYLQIFDGDSENSKSMLRICNNQQNPGHILSTGNAMLLRFRSDFSEEAGGFHVSYQTICTNVLTKRRGVIESPNFPNSYPHNHNCTWTIEAPLGNNISLSFSHLFIEEDEECGLDYVEILEVKQPNAPVRLGKFCGDMTKPPPTIYTSTNTAIVRLITDRSVGREGFRLEWTMIGCGGDIINKDGEITSPNYPGHYPLQTDCYWHIWYPPGSRVQFTVEDFDLEREGACNFDFLRVYAGENVNSPLLLNICHHFNNATTITSHGNEILVHFQSDEIVSHRGFKASYRKLESGCGGIFTVSDAFIMSPNYPDPYTANDECEWLIEVASNFLVVLEFNDFELPEAVNCSHGHVAVYDGSNSSAPLLLRHCGANPERIVSSTSNKMLVKLVADGNNIAKGFKAHYKTGCGSRLLADTGGEIRSLNYPDYSPRGTNCSWIIQASDRGQKVSLTITHLTIRVNVNCSFVSLDVYDGDMEDSPLIGQYCGHHIPPPIISRGNVLHVFLKGMGSFRATYGLLSEHCGGEFFSPSGSFASPGFPTNYDMEMECVWTVEASIGSKVHVSFQSFQLESSDYCNTDYVEIHENDPSGKLIGKYCGNSIPNNVTSAHKLWIKFRSDDIGTAPGFMAHYEIEHGVTINGTSGYIASPGYPHKFQSSTSSDNRFEWTVIAPDGMVVSVQILELNIVIYNPNSDCSASHLMIYDGLDNTAPILGRFCGSDIPEPVISTGNVVTIAFEGHSYFPSIFYLHWSAVNDFGASVSANDCLHLYLINGTSEAQSSNNTTLVQSTNYPDNYPNGQNCTYVIKTQPQYHIELKFDRFEMEGSPPSCNFDKLESYYAPNPNVDEWVLNSTLCGVLSDLHLSSPNNAMKLYFITDQWLNYPGFNATATAECGGHLFGNTGVLHSSSIYPYIRDSTSYSFQCEWIITVKGRRTIQLTFENFRIDSDSVCSKSYIMIKNGGSSSSPILGNGRYCGSSLPVLPETSSNEVYIQVVHGTGTNVPVFDLHYSIVTMGCGGHIYLDHDTPYTEITSPGHPSPPTHDAECEWIITSPSGTRMRLDFESEINFQSSCYDYNFDGADNEYLQLHDGGTEMADILRRFCIYDEPSSVMTTGNALFMRYVAASNNPGTGFKATVRIAHCGGTITAFQSTIQSPDFPRNYGSSIECEWFLKMTYGYHLTLILTEFETPEANNCSFTDYLQIRNADAEGDVLRTFCGKPDNLPITIDVPSSNAYIKFKSDSSTTAKGFSLEMNANYDGYCGNMQNPIEDPSGIITSPGYPNALPTLRDCNWVIYAPEGRGIKITFDALNLPRDENLNQCNNYVSVYNVTHYRVSREHAFPYRFCGNTLPPEINSPSSAIYIAFYAQGLSAGQGFSLRYSTEQESTCGGVLTGRSGVLSTPVFPVQNDSYVDCRWRIDIEENQTLSVRLSSLNVPGILANFCRKGVLYFAPNSGIFLGGVCGNYSNGLSFTFPFASIRLRLISSLEEPSVGFRGTYNISDCGGLLDGSNAVIMSPGYPNSYPQSVDCHWLFSVPYGEIIRLTVEDLRLETDCKKDYVLIRNGIHIQSPVIGKFCGTQPVAPIVSTGNMLSVIFHSDEFGTSPGFKITTSEVQRGCGGLIHMLQGNFSSPNYPSRYENNVECVWTIEMHLGFLIELRFEGRFDIETDLSCSKDYLKFEYTDDEERWIEQEKKCGSVTPNPITSTTNKMRITFHSNERIVGDGFNLFYKAVCGGNFSKPIGTVISPNYPSSYLNELNCTYYIGKQGDYISLTFDDYFSIEGGFETCLYDYVEIYQQEINETKSQGKFCGGTPPASRTLLGPVILRFITDYSFVAHGFSLRYEILNCGAVLTSPTGVITTPTATNEYINGMDCTWRILAQPSMVIQLRFMYFEVVESYNCVRDYLEIFDSNSTVSTIGRYCGNRAPSVKSTGSYLTLRFHSNYRITSRGFAAYYYNTYGEAHGCGGLLNSTTGEMISLDADSDGHYEPNLDCGWLIIVTVPDQIVKLTFNSFDLQESSNSSCLYDYVEIRELGPSGPILGSYCGSTVPNPIMTTSNRVFVHFHSDDTGSNSGFKIVYTVTPSLCGPSTLLASPTKKELTSPNYPSTYPINLRCKWTITRNSSSYYRNLLIEVSISDFNVPCGGGDYFELKKRTRWATPEGHTRTCGTISSHTFQVRGSFEVVLKSDETDNAARGFSLTYKEATCNTTFSEDGGVIISSAYPSRYNLGEICFMNITVSEGKTVSIYFTRFDMVGAHNCTVNYMKIFNGTSTSDPLIATYCGFLNPNPVFATGRSLLLEANMEVGMGLYHITYMASDKGRGCGGSIYAAEGAFSSPLYPQPYRETGECIWQIRVPGYHAVRIIFSSFALNSTSGCDVNYLEIYEGTSDDISNRIVRFCGQDIPSNHKVNNNQALVKLVTDSTNDQSGFMLVFVSTYLVISDTPSRIEQIFEPE